MLVRPALLTLIAACCALAQDPNVSITWIGQSCFNVAIPGVTTVVTDPPVASVGYTLPPLNADVVTITHNHTDHNNSAGIGGKFTLVDGRPVTARQEVTAAGLKFVMIPGFHDNSNGAVRGPNTMMVWTQGGIKFAHLGDLGQDQLTAAQLADLAGVDVLFIAAGGFFTVTPERAAGYVNELKPRVAILMHYKTALGGPAQLAGLPASAAPFSPLRYKPATVVVNRATLPASTEVWAMQPVSDAAVANAASFEAGAPVAPGSVVSIFGKFTASQTVGAATYPLPRKLGETEVLIDGKAAPLYYASPGQVNFQLPAARAVGQGLAEVRVGGQPAGRAPVTVLANAAGIFGAVNQDGRVNSASAAARRGEVLHIFATGLGAASPAVEDGAAAPSQPLANGIVMPNVFLGGRQLAPLFNGLAPGLAGVWQIDVLIPADASTGPEIPLVVEHGTTSNTVTIAVVPAAQ
uniref:Zn-dependent hydrolase of the beta-lactamase fold-like protein n=1 Tax=Solibacter usitatus (strain Ellin6076) TaxID=234267 RepID=Q01QX4_SOLUE